MYTCKYEELQDETCSRT